VTAPRTRGTALLGVLLVLVTALSGCGLFGDSSGSKATSSPSSAAPSFSSSQPSSTPSTLAGYYQQSLHWSACGSGHQCARLQVPLDYAHPAGRSIQLAVLKVPALDKAKRLGSMVVNPGGPGASGVDYARSAATVYGKKIREAYDVVGFDPRGVGSSTALSCLSDHQLDRLVASDPDPDTAAERRQSDALTKQLGDGCLEKSGSLTRHVSTVEVAKDLDVLRAALGDRKLTYFGASYGTSIGATYASLFPTHVGRMVLDGALDASVPLVPFNLVQAHGFEVALRAYVAACVAKGDCYLGSTVDAGIARIQRFMRDVEARPLRDRTGEVPIGLAIYGIYLPLYNQRLWPVLDRALQNAFNGDPGILRLAAYEYLGRSPAGHWDNELEAFDAITCLDRDEGVPIDKVESYVPRFEKASPTFGRVFAYSLPLCSVWPVHSGRHPKALHVTKAPPVLIVGTTRDPATPLVWAQSLHRQIGRSVLVTRDGDGHTGYHAGSSCVDDTVESYLVDDTVPDKDVSCS
jgi:pimeloyl-ACP methyl ester carboxylesterase